MHENLTAERNYTDALDICNSCDVEPMADNAAGYCDECLADTDRPEGIYVSTADLARFRFRIALTNSGPFGGGPFSALAHAYAKRGRDRDLVVSGRADAADLTFGVGYTLARSDTSWEDRYNARALAAHPLPRPYEPDLTERAER